MPIIGATQIQPVNFLESYARGRQLGEAERALQQQEVDRIRGVEQQRLLNQLYSQSMTPTGALDMNALGRQMITAGMGAQVPALQAQQAEIGLKTAQARKAESEVRPAEWKQLREELAALPDNDQARYQSWAAGLLRRAPWAIDFLAPTLTADSKRQMLMTADAALPKGEIRDVVGGIGTIDPYTGKQIGSVVPKVPLSADLEAQEARLRRSGRAVTNVNLPPLEKEESGEKGKLNVRIYEDIRNRATSAVRLLPKIQASRAVLDKGFETGLFAPAKTEAARFLSAIGVQDAAQYAADAQTFKATAQERVLERQLEQKGVQTTSDAARMEQTFARLGNEVEANRFLFDVAEAQAKYEIETRKFWDNWWNKNGTYEGVEDAWDKAGGSKSIFDDPKLKKYVEPRQEAAAGAPVRVNSAEEAKKLKPGTIFITPDGRQKVR